MARRNGPARSSKGKKSEKKSEGNTRWGGTSMPQQSVQETFTWEEYEKRHNTPVVMPAQQQQKKPQPQQPAVMPSKITLPDAADLGWGTDELGWGTDEVAT